MSGQNTAGAEANASANKTQNQQTVADQQAAEAKAAADKKAADKAAKEAAKKAAQEAKDSANVETANSVALDAPKTDLKFTQFEHEGRKLQFKQANGGVIIFQGQDYTPEMLVLKQHSKTLEYLVEHHIGLFDEIFED